MSLARVLSKRAFQGAFVVMRRQQPQRFLSTSASTAGDDWTGTWALAGAVAAGVGAATCNTVLCEEEYSAARRKKDGLKDPMTSYQQKAIQRAMTERLQKQKEAREASNEEDANRPPEDVPPQESPVRDSAPTTMHATSLAVDTTTLQGDMTQSEAKIEEATRKAKQHSGGLKIFSGNANLALAMEITRHLGVNLGKATVGRFADGEVKVEIHENVRGKDVYIVQPTGPPVNDNMMELLLMVSTLRRSSARRITVVIPYYGYARQDRKMQVRFAYLFIDFSYNARKIPKGTCSYFRRGHCSIARSHGH